MDIEPPASPMTRFDMFETWLRLHPEPLYATPFRGGPPNPHIYQVKDEIKEFFTMLEGEPHHTLAMEIGLAKGATHYLWRLLYEGVISIEKYPFNVGLFMGEMNARGGFPLGKGSNFIIGDYMSSDTIAEATQSAQGGLDMLFIDGNHSLEAVEADHSNYAPLVRDGGVVAFHDAISRDTGVPTFLVKLEETLPSPLKRIIHSEDTGIAWYRKGAKG